MGGGKGRGRGCVSALVVACGLDAKAGLRGDSADGSWFREPLGECEMVTVMDEFLAALQPRVHGVLKGSAKLVITGVGSVMMDETGAREGDGAVDVTLSASEGVFRAIMDGSQNPVMAVMSGKLKVDGDMGMAMTLASVLS